MKTQVLRLFIISIFFVISSCAQKATKLDLPKANLKDYTFETSPTNAMTVGYIFVVDKNKAQYKVGNLNLGEGRYSIVVPKKFSQKDISWEALLSYIGGTYDASGQIKSTTKITTAFVLDQAILEQGTLMALDQALKTQKESIISAISSSVTLVDPKTYVVLEVIKSKKLTYDFSKSKIGTQTLKAGLENYLQANENIKWDKTNFSSITYDVGTELTVFYKMIELRLELTTQSLSLGSNAKVDEFLFTSFQNLPSNKPNDNPIVLVERTIKYGPFGIQQNKVQTSIAVKAGDKVRVVSNGAIDFGGAVFGVGAPILDGNGDNNGNGSPSNYPAPSLVKNSLIVDIAGKWYQGGTDRTFIPDTSGTITLFCNDGNPNDNSRGWSVEVYVTTSQ